MSSITSKDIYGDQPINGDKGVNGDKGIGSMDIEQQGQGYPVPFTAIMPKTLGAGVGQSDLNNGVKTDVQFSRH